MSIFHNQNHLLLDSKNNNHKGKLQDKQNSNTINIDSQSNLNILITDNTNAINRLQLSVKKIQTFLQSHQTFLQSQIKKDSSIYQNRKNENMLHKQQSKNLIDIECLLQKRLLQMQNQLNLSKKQFEYKTRQYLFQLQKGINQKSNKQQVQKAINLSKLLCIQIEQLKQKQKITQKKSFSLQNMNKQKHEQLQNMYQIILNKFNQANQSSFQQKNNMLLQKIRQLQNKIIGFCCQKQQKLQKQSQQYQKLIDKIDVIRKVNKESIKQVQCVQNNCQYALKSFSQRLDSFQNLFKQTQSFYLKIDQFKNQIFQIQNKTQQIQIKLKNSQSKLIHQIEQSLNNNKKQYEKISTKFYEKIMEQINLKFILKKQALSQFQQTGQKFQNFNNLHVLIQNKIKKFETQTYNLENQIAQQKQHNLELFTKIINDITLKTQKNQLLKQISKYVRKQQFQETLIKLSQKTQLIIQKNKKQQKIINNALCSENIVARWLWDGDIKGGNLVNWSKSVINTLPQNFSYFDKEYVIYILSSGLYRIQMGFYSKKKPTVQILVNGKMVVSAVNSSSYVIHHSSGKLKQVGSSQVTGLTYIDFLMIPEASRIAITYNSQTKGEGFININRL